MRWGGPWAEEGAEECGLTVIRSSLCAGDGFYEAARDPESFFKCSQAARKPKSKRSFVRHVFVSSSCADFVLGIPRAGHFFLMFWGGPWAGKGSEHQRRQQQQERTKH